MSVGLLDVNVLIALAWPSHVRRRDAHGWFRANRSAGWATCPLTQYAFVRISSNPRVIQEAVEPREELELLKQITSLEDYVFWPDNVPMTEGPVPTRLLVSHSRSLMPIFLAYATRTTESRLRLIEAWPRCWVGPRATHCISCRSGTRSQSRPPGRPRAAISVRGVPNENNC